MRLSEEEAAENDRDDRVDVLVGDNLRDRCGVEEPRVGGECDEWAEDGEVCL